LWQRLLEQMLGFSELKVDRRDEQVEVL